MHNQFTEDETNVVIHYFSFGTKDSITTILVANYNNKNGSSSSNNTTTYLATHDFNLLYSRRRRPKLNNNDNDNNDNDNDDDGEEEEFIATLISITPISGILEAKIEPSASRRGGGGGGGKTHEEAFAAFKKYVEVILGKVLKSVPDAVPDVATTTTTVSSSPSEITIEQQQPPPAYEVGRDALFVEGGGGVGKF